MKHARIKSWKSFYETCVCLLTLPPKSKYFPQVLLFYQNRTFPRRDLFILLSVRAVQCLALQDPVLHVFIGILLITVINNE